MNCCTCGRVIREVDSAQVIIGATTFDVHAWCISTLSARPEDDAEAHEEALAQAALNAAI